MSASPRLTLRLLPEDFAACRLEAEATLPSWADPRQATSLLSITRTLDELSLILEWKQVPVNLPRQGPFRALVVQGPLPFDAVGILASLTHALAGAGVPLLSVSTYDTDYVLVKAGLLERAVDALHAAGHTVLEA